MMKKKVFAAVAAIAVIFGVGLTLSHNEANAASWGAKTLYTTPKSVRGTWYSKQGKKVRTWKITAHTLNGVKLYKSLSDKEEAPYIKKLEALPDNKLRETNKYLQNHQLEAKNITYKGILGFNASGWLAAGDGNFYTPVTRTVNGKKVKALRIGTGANNTFWHYAYKNKSLAK